MYVALFYIKEDRRCFDFQHFTTLFLEEISPHFSFEKITESSDRFFSNYSLLGLTLNFFPISTLVPFSNSISLLCWLDDMPQGFGNEIKTEFHSQL